MKKTLLITLALSITTTASFGQKIEKVPFGDFENWTVRYIQESPIIGGETKVNYVIAPTDTIRKNAPYSYSKTIWGSSNAYAVVMGVTKVTCSVSPDKGPTGRCARLENTMVSVKAAGMISVNVLATGAIFWGKMLEPLTSPNNPMAFLDWGIPFTKRPVAVIIDFKAYLPNTGKIKKGNKEIDGYDPEQIMFILQNRSKDEKGNTHVTRVGTAVHRIEKSTDGWVRNFRIPVIYGDATKDEAFKSYMDLLPKKKAPLPEDDWGSPDTPVTHAYLSCSSGTQSDMSGAVGNILWIDNVRLEY